MLTQERLKELLDYDPETGVFVWKVSKKGGKAKAGLIAGYINGRGYVCIKINGKSYLAHRLVWFYTYGIWPDKELDHINRVKTDNRVPNLRVVSHSENMWNTGKPVDNTSGYMGVGWHRKTQKWQAHISAFGKQKYLGIFDTPEAAHAAYIAAKEQLHSIGE